MTPSISSGSCLSFFSIILLAVIIGNRANRESEILEAGWQLERGVYYSAEALPELQSANGFQFSSVREAGEKTQLTGNEFQVSWISGNNSQPSSVRHAERIRYVF